MLQMRTDMVSVTLTPKQWANLQTLHDYLVENRDLIEPHFDMESYVRIGHNIMPLESLQVFPKLIHECGSVGCLIGNSPAAGVLPLSGEKWDFYAHRVYGAGNLESGFCDPEPLWDWLFTGDWAFEDNTLDGAIKRLEYTLLHRAVPKEYA